MGVVFENGVAVGVVRSGVGVGSGARGQAHGGTGHRWRALFRRRLHLLGRRCTRRWNRRPVRTANPRMLGIRGGSHYFHDALVQRTATPGPACLSARQASHESARRPLAHPGHPNWPAPWATATSWSCPAHLVHLGHLEGGSPRAAGHRTQGPPKDAGFIQGAGHVWWVSNRGCRFVGPVVLGFGAITHSGVLASCPGHPAPRTSVGHPSALKAAPVPRRAADEVGRPSAPGAAT